MYVLINNQDIVVCVVRVRKVQDGLTVLVWFQSNNKLGVQIDNLVIDMHFNVFGHNVKCLFVIRCYSLSTYSFRVHASRYVHNLVPEVVVYIRHMPHLAGQNLL